MKKLLSLVSLLMVSLGAWAGYFTVVSPYDSPGGESASVVVMASFVTNESNASYEIAAFVDGECRAIANPVANGYTLRVPTSDPTADEGKTISFRAYNSRTGCEYELTSSAAVAFGSGGDGTVVTTLTLNAPTRIELGEITMNVGESVDLTDYLTVTPDGASLPLNQTPTWGMGQLGTLAGHTFSATQPTQESSYSVTIGRLSATGKIHISQPATSIVINRPYEITLRMDEDNATLNELLTVSPRNTHYTVTPENTTDQVSWEIADPTIIGQSAAGGGYVLLKPGTTTVTPIVTHSDGTVLRPTDPTAITVTVVQPVKQVKFNWNSDNPNKANVGDNVAQRLAGLLQILPENATNKGYHFVVSHLLSDGTLDSDGVTQTDNSIVFTKEGYYQVQVVADDNAQLGDYMKFQVENPAKTVTFAQSELSILSDETSQDFLADVARQVNANISLGPDGWKLASGTITVTTGALTINERETGVSNEGANVSVTAAAEGSSTVTVTLQWNDYSQYNGNASSVGTQTGTPQSFTVTIESKLRGFNVFNTLDADGTGTLRLEPIPAGAQYDAAKIQIAFDNTGYPDSWTKVSITNRTNGADAISLTYAAPLPGQFSVSAKELTDGGGSVGYELYDGNASDGQQTVFDGFRVPAAYSFASGWQWCSNVYGDLTDNGDGQAKDNYNEFFAERFMRSFGEARTQTALLINDDAWGLFSDGAFAISQSQCYKIRMKAAGSTTMTYGSFKQEGQTASLYKGWTWVGSPFVYDRQLANAFSTLTLPVGTRIVSKNGGFAEWDGRGWTGTLQVVGKRQGYLVYCPDEGASLPFKSEYAMTQGDETTAGARRLTTSVWSYDDSRFASNMTMIASLKDAGHVGDYTVGAFVGGECRGEGVAIDGRLFITVHANSGEQVTFRLHNELTGEYFDVAETVKCQQMLGTLQAPVVLTVPAFTTGINDVTRLANLPATEVYDLQGRKNAKARLTIVRTADGRVRKVLK